MTDGIWHLSCPCCLSFVGESLKTWASGGATLSTKFRFKVLADGFTKCSPSFRTGGCSTEFSIGYCFAVSQSRENCQRVRSSNRRAAVERHGRVRWYNSHKKDGGAAIDCGTPGRWSITPLFFLYSFASLANPRWGDWWRPIARSATIFCQSRRSVTRRAAARARSNMYTLCVAAINSIYAKILVARPR